MSDAKYCYPNSDVLINKLNIQDAKERIKHLKDSYEEATKIERKSVRKKLLAKQIEIKNNSGNEKNKKNKYIEMSVTEKTTFRRY